MVLRFRCHDCGQGYRATPDRCGDRFVCTRCGWPGRVPGRKIRERERVATTSALPVVPRRVAEAESPSARGAAKAEVR